MKKILSIILILTFYFCSPCHAGMLMGSGVDAGSVACAGTIQGGDNESFEKGAGLFCTTGFVETDTEGVINTYSATQSNCGTHSLHIADHTTTIGNIETPIIDDTAFTMRFYFRVDSSVTPDFSNIIFLSLYDSTTTPENAIGIRHDTGTEYRLFFNSLVGSYFSLLPDTWYYTTITWDGTGTADGTTMKMYNTSGVAQSATNGLDGTTISSTETDGISSMRFYSGTIAASLYIDDFIFSASAADLSGVQSCE